MDTIHSLASHLPPLSFSLGRVLNRTGLAAEQHRVLFTLKYFFLPIILFALVLGTFPQKRRISLTLVSRRKSGGGGEGVGGGYPININISHRCIYFFIFVLYFIVCSNLASLGMYRTGHVWFDHSIGTTVGSCLLNAFHVLVFVDPFKEYRHRNDKARIQAGGGGPNEEPSWLKRVYWAWCVLMSLRGIGWNYQMPHIPPRLYKKTVSRSKFIGYLLWNLLLCYIIVDLTQTILRSAPFLLNHHRRAQQEQQQRHLPVAGSVDSGSLSLSFSLRSLPFHQRAICVATWFLSGYAAISAQYYLVALVCVSSTLSEPEDWPPPFGSLTCAWSVRNFWGKTWHSFIRRFCMSPGTNLVEILRIPPKSLLAGIVKLYTTFLISALLHSLGDYTIAPELYGYSFRFFILQPVAITIEEVVMMAVRRLYGRSVPIPIPIQMEAGDGGGDNGNGLVVVEDSNSEGSRSPGCLSESAESESESSAPPSTTRFSSSLLLIQPSPWLKTLGRVIGYMWVIWWLTETAPFLLDPAMMVGFDRHRIFPYSPLSGVAAWVYPGAVAV
ncbi:hypothetical protein D9757_004428 [Collybiopsis confluens]|uniref:Wax synthase domain-containing protein n=1 Tax=Collybiopsis confluens TaxID=2823264 RepID=A0A8H5MEJ5_9AGAR|nr:hypothetical protein D9757_004428 [Collybiopsis confluens]